MIEGILAAGQAGEDETIHHRRTQGVEKDYAACHDPADGRSTLLFQHVPEPKTVKDRIHLDLQRLDDDRPRERGRPADRARGATKLYDGQHGP